jgi:hypothetical protein
MTEADIAKLADAGQVQETLYLIGTFLVTATSEDRVILRSQPKAGPCRVLVHYPPSIPTPTPGATLTRDESRAFLITEIRPGAPGQITVYVREIATP